MVMGRPLRRHTDAAAAAAYRTDDPFSADDLNVRVGLANIVDVACAAAPGTCLGGGGPGQSQLVGHGSEYLWARRSIATPTCPREATLMSGSITLEGLPSTQPC